MIHVGELRVLVEIHAHLTPVDRRTARGIPLTRERFVAHADDEKGA